MEQPTVTYIWRQDRLWQSDDALNRLRQGLDRVFGGRIGWKAGPLMKQTEKVILLAELLREQVKNLQFAVVGIGDPSGLPAWIDDLRTSQIDDDLESRWCEQYANSHVVLGIHGSNMLLPSAHAGATIVLMPSERWGNFAQDTLISEPDARMATFRYRYLPCDLQVFTLAGIIDSLLRDCFSVELNFSPSWNDHPQIQRDPRSLVQTRLSRMRRIAKKP
jgi:hypothetical protein